MRINKHNIEFAEEVLYEGERLRTIALENGKILFLACDLANNIIGIKGYTKLYNAVDKRCKGDTVITFDESINPQRYKFVDVYGLMCMVFRARECKVNRLDFIQWAQKRRILIGPNRLR
ncbi:hypothetical protein [Metabacillus fastidiosus]|uniref:hypothetical protein n=1 Tax=Metabacillus fastidiosus TaxID=1458 RepID=UPI003D28EB2B